MKTPILFLHGALATESQFDSLRKSLPNDLQLLALTFSGHGGKMFPANGLSFEAFTQDILNFLNENKIEKVNLFGFSMGGYAAYYFAHKYPNRVNRIFSVNVKFKWDPISTAKETGWLDPDKMMEKIPGFANNLMMQHGMNLWKQVLRSTSDMMNELSKGILLSDDDLSKIDCPIRIGIGDRDQTSSIAETINVFKQFKNASLWVIPDTNHPFERMNEERLKLEILDFFSEI